MIKQTQPAKSFEIPLTSYKEYIKQNVNRNAELTWARTPTDAQIMANAKRNETLGRNYLLSKVKLLF